MYPMLLKWILQREADFVVQPTSSPSQNSPNTIHKGAKKGMLYIIGMDELLNPDWVHLPGYLELPPRVIASELGIIEALVKAQKFQLDLASGNTTGPHSLWFLVTDGPNAAHYEKYDHVEEMRLEAQAQAQDEELEYA